MLAKSLALVIMFNVASIEVKEIIDKPSNRNKEHKIEDSIVSKTRSTKANIDLLPDIKDLGDLFSNNETSNEGDEKKKKSSGSLSNKERDIRKYLTKLANDLKNIKALKRRHHKSDNSYVLLNILKAIGSLPKRRQYDFKYNHASWARRKQNKTHNIAKKQEKTKLFVGKYKKKSKTAKPNSARKASNRLNDDQQTIKHDNKSRVDTNDKSKSADKSDSSEEIDTNSEGKDKQSGDADNSKESKDKDKSDNEESDISNKSRSSSDNQSSETSEELSNVESEASKENSKLKRQKKKKYILIPKLREKLKQAIETTKPRNQDITSSTLRDPVEEFDQSANTSRMQDGMDDGNDLKKPYEINNKVSSETRKKALVNERPADQTNQDTIKYKNGFINIKPSKKRPQLKNIRRTRISIEYHRFPKVDSVRFLETMLKNYVDIRMKNITQTNSVNDTQKTVCDIDNETISNIRLLMEAIHDDNAKVYPNHADKNMYIPPKFIQYFKKLNINITDSLQN